MHHVRSSSGRVSEYPVGALGGATATVPELLAETLPALRAVMRRAAYPEARQRLFERWTEALGIPERAHVERLEVTAITSAGGVELLLIESPEPLPFSEDVAIEVWRRMVRRPQRPDLPSLDEARLEEAGAAPEDRGREAAEVAWLPTLSGDRGPMYQPRHTRVLSNGDETRALVIPSDVTTAACSILPRGDYRLDLRLARERYPAAPSDAAARLEQDVTLHVRL